MVRCAAFPPQISMNNLMVKNNATNNSIRFYILTTFGDSSSFCNEQLLYLFLFRWDVFIFSVGIVMLVSKSDSSQSENMYFFHFLRTLFGADGSIWHVNLTAEELCTVHWKDGNRDTRAGVGYRYYGQDEK